MEKAYSLDLSETWNEPTQKEMATSIADVWIYANEIHC